MKQFNKEKCVYASLPLDEGSTLKMQYLDYVLHNTKYKLVEYVCRCTSNARLQSKRLQGDNTKRITLHFKFFVRISTIVVNGNKAQLKALLVLKNSPSEMISKIIIVLCLCHWINNAYKFAVNHTDKLNGIMNDMLNIVKVLNSSK